MQERVDYGDVRSWLLNLYNRIIRRFPRMPLPGRGKVILISVVNTSVPVAVRLGTSDIFVANEIFSHNEYDFVWRQLPALKTIIDLGANIGLSLRYWREKYPQSFVVGVEPDRDNARLCRLNARLHKSCRGRTFVIRACAGGSSRMITLNRSEDAWAFQMGAEVKEAEKDRSAVHVHTIPQILSRTECSGEIDLLKCDIEGGEEELFQNCRGWIEKERNMAVEVHPPYTIEKLTAALERNGAAFRIVEADDKGGDLFVVLLRRAESGS